MAAFHPKLGLRGALRAVGEGYPAAKFGPMRGHPVERLITKQAPAAVKAALEESERHARATRRAGRDDTLSAGVSAYAAALVCRGRCGFTHWASVPWLGVFDPDLTVSATVGAYVVYLFRADTTAVHLTVTHGAEGVRRRYRSATREVLDERTAKIREAVPEFAPRFRPGPVELGSNNLLPKDYERAVAFAKTYPLPDLPSEETLVDDLAAAVALLSMFKARGGLSLVADEATRE